MHLAYLDRIPEATRLDRRKLLQAGAAMVLGGFGGAAAAASATPTATRGFKGSGRMGMSTAEDWIDTFFEGGADAIVDYYADRFVFEDVTLFQAIDTKAELHRAFLPFANLGPDSPAGVHQFDVIRYDGGRAGDRRAVMRSDVPAGYTAEAWAQLSAPTRMGADLDYDEWGVIQWLWKARHNMDDFLGIPNARGKTTTCAGITFHCYRQRKIVRETTQWNLRDVAIQLGYLPAPVKFWQAAQG